jgi:hypothetical protein
MLAASAAALLAAVVRCFEVMVGGFRGLEVARRAPRKPLRLDFGSADEESGLSVCDVS